MSGVSPTAIRSAASVVPSYSPGSSPLSIGSVIFNSAECPSDLPIGAVKQMLVVHTLPGGSRVVNTFGPSPSTVSWSGKLFSTNVQGRIEQLRLYAVSGEKILLSWLNEQYNVIVSDFTPHYHQQWYAEYNIEVTVVSDANGAFTVPNGLSIDAQVQGLQIMMLEQNNIVFQFDPVGSAGIQNALPGVTQAIAKATPLATASKSGIAGINSAINTALSAINTYIGPLQQLAPSVVPQLASALQLASSVTAIGLTANRGQQPNSQLAQGTSLFAIAAQNYGDPTLAFQLSAANGLISPFLSANKQQTIVLPPLQGQNQQ